MHCRKLIIEIIQIIDVVVSILTSKRNFHQEKAYEHGEEYFSLTVL